jgi:hypothetical protein
VRGDMVPSKRIKDGLPSNCEQREIVPHWIVAEQTFRLS